jgi:HTH-type transcriptional regulator/antitoxin HipB
MNNFPIKTRPQLGAFLQGYRRKRGLTQKDVGAKVGMTQKAVSKIELAPGRTRLSLIFKVLAALDLELVVRPRGTPGLRQDGTVVAWGVNNAGQTDVPPGLSHVIAVAGGGLSSVAIVLPSAEISRQAHPQHHVAVYALAAVIFLALVVSFWLRSRHGSDSACVTAGNSISCMPKRPL